MTPIYQTIYGGLTVAILAALVALRCIGISRVLMWIGIEMRVLGDSLRSASIDRDVRAKQRVQDRRVLRAERAEAMKQEVRLG